MRLFRVAPVLTLVSAAFLASCGGQPSFVVKDEPWRAEDERACLEAHVARSNPYATPRAALGGPSVCGAIRPFDVSAANQGRVRLTPAATLRCPMVPAVDHWVRTVVEPAGERFFGQPVVQLKVAASYACRPMNHQSGGRLSEHGFANALDVSAFHLADGRVITVRDGWTGSRQERAFLETVYTGACQTFTTVLGPRADAAHSDHFHLDLARHGRTGEGRVCR
jgi:hypothetical protein